MIRFHSVPLLRPVALAAMLTLACALSFDAVAQDQPAPAQEPQAPAPAEAPAPGPADGKKSPVGGGEGITIRSDDGNYTMQLGLIGQFRFRAYDRSLVRRKTVTGAIPIPVEDIGQVEKTFNIRLLRLYLRGNAYRPWLTYKLEIDMVSNDEGLREVFIPPDPQPPNTAPAVLIRAGSETLDGRTLKLMDFYLDGKPRPYAGFRLGQFKVPLGRQELVPDQLLQMPERSIASNFFAPGRDRGAAFKGATEEEKISYQAGVFNGTGLTQGQNIDDSLAYAFRLTATSGGPYLDIESNIDAPAAFHAQGGASWYDNTRRVTATSDPQSLLGDIMEDRLSVDLEFFWPKVNLLAEYFQGNVQVDDSISIRMQQICFGAYQKGLLTCHQSGFNVQSGVLLGGGRHEISGRYSQIDPDRDLDRDHLEETSLNYTFFFMKHALRWSTSISALTLEVNAPGSSGLAVQQGDASNGGLVQGFPNPDGFTPVLKDDHNHLLITQLQWMF